MYLSPHLSHSTCGARQHRVGLNHSGVTRCFTLSPLSQCKPIHILDWGCKNSLLINTNARIAIRIISQFWNN